MTSGRESHLGRTSFVVTWAVTQNSPYYLQHEEFLRVKIHARIFTRSFRREGPYSGYCLSGDRGHPTLCIEDAKKSCSNLLQFCSTRSEKACIFMKIHEHSSI